MLIIRILQHFSYTLIVLHISGKYANFESELFVELFVWLSGNEIGCK